MTPTQEAYREWIMAYKVAHGVWPLHRETAEHFGVVPDVARKHVYELVEANALARRGRGRPKGVGRDPPPQMPDLTRSQEPGVRPDGWRVVLSRPDRAVDRTVAMFDTEAEARASARAHNDALNRKEGVPRWDGGPFAFYYVVGRNNWCSATTAAMREEEDG